MLESTPPIWWKKKDLRHGWTKRYLKTLQWLNIKHHSSNDWSVPFSFRLAGMYNKCFASNPLYEMRMYNEEKLP